MMAELEPHACTSARLISKPAMQPSWAHNQAPSFCGDLVRYPSLASNNNLGNNNNTKSLGGVGRQAKLGAFFRGSPDFEKLRLSVCFSMAYSFASHGGV